MGQQRIALITGGAKRVGRAIAEKLAREGFKVAFTFNSSSAEANDLAKQIGGIAIKADLTEPATAVQRIVQTVITSFTGLDLLVNNASLFAPAGLDETDLALSRKLMAIHYESPLLLCKGLAPLLRAARGHVVNMLDITVERPLPKYLAYCASKAALWNLTLSLARELSPQVTVNGIAPGVVQWPEEFGQMEKDNYLKRVPLGRAGTPQDVAETVYFLATGGSYINGQIIPVDGGRSIV